MNTADMLTIAKNIWQDTAAFWGLHPYLCWGFVVVILINNGIRVTYRDFSTRPRWAKFIVATTDPIAGNFWRLTLKIADKAGINLQAPDSTDTVSPQVVADAVKRDAAAVQDMANVVKKAQS